MAGYKYFWRCPNCGTSLELKMRVTQTKRKCPECGTLVTPEEIDRQREAMQTTMTIVLIALFFVAILLCNQCGPH
jgi:uncharacterized Zn finger protein